MDLTSQFDMLLEKFTTSTIADKDPKIDNTGLNPIKPELFYGSAVQHSKMFSSKTTFQTSNAKQGGDIRLNRHH